MWGGVGWEGGDLVAVGETKAKDTIKAPTLIGYAATPLDMRIVAVVGDFVCMRDGIEGGPGRAAECVGGGWMGRASQNTLFSRIPVPTP